MLKTYLQENQIIVPSYQHYGGLSGFQDYGVIGCQIKNKLTNMWREFFIGNEISEVEIPTIMPHSALKASGHVERFTDYVVYDNFGECYRADHFAKKWFDDNNMIDLSNLVDSWDQTTLEENINKYKMMDAINEKKFLELHSHKDTNYISAVEFDLQEKFNAKLALVGLDAVYRVNVLKKNLMIEVPSNTLVQDAVPDFLRPELAQGIFVNFKHYLNFLQKDNDFKQFGIAQIGKSYRKEISPQPLTRMREFTQAEIEYFVDPLNKSHPYINEYLDLEIPLLTDSMQEDGINSCVLMKLDSALKSNIINHELIAYFLAKIYTFAIKIGLKPNLIRFRQHQKNEMAHYASQCWDLECFVSNNNNSGYWLECVGCADRGSYDLTAHTEANPKQPLNAKRKLAQPVKSIETIIKPNAATLSKAYGKSTNTIKTYFESLDQVTALTISSLIKNQDKFKCTINNIDYEFASNIFIIDQKQTTTTHELFIPHVIEPSFGIDRLMFAIFDQNLWQRESDNRRLVLSLPPELTIYDVAVFPLHKKDLMINLANDIRSKLISHKLKCYYDDSSTAIGKKYVRCDEIGVRHVITIDPGSVEHGIVTIRDRDTMKQISVQTNDVYDTLMKMSN